MKKVRTRFAPSPTGYLHIGGARTALYSWLFAQVNNGEFILRVEDTDLKRNSEEATVGILEAMDWLGLDFEHGPYYQSQNFARYNEVIEEMIAAGTAYRCFCTKEELDAIRAEQESRKEPIKYPGIWRDKTPTPEQLAQPHVIRFRNKLEGSVTFNDLIRGEITFNNAELDDFIIRRQDGSPTYNFCVVVDDSDMEITHVIRGEDHINNTPRQINIFKALGKDVPEFAHVSMINGEDKKKLSKRHGAVNVMQFKEEGYLKEALLNYIVRLGWGYKDQEIFSMSEIISLFDITTVSKNPAIFDFNKLKWLNQQYIRELSTPDLVLAVRPFITYETSTGPALEDIIPLYVDRSHTLVDFAQEMAYMYSAEVSIDIPTAMKVFKPSSHTVFTDIIREFEELEYWNAENIHHIMKLVADNNEVGMGQVGMPLRLALTGKGQTPAINELAYFLGKEKCIARILQAKQWLSEHAK